MEGTQTTDGIDLPVREATDAVAIALIAYVTSDDERLAECFDYFTSQTNGASGITLQRFNRDLNAVREALENMGYHFP